MKKLFLLYLIVLSSLSFANANAKQKDSNLTHQEDILLVCMRANYAELGVDVLAFNDYSGNRYTLNTSRKISEFIDKEAGHFYKEEYAFKADGGKSPNMIFHRCVNFSKSTKVKRFLKTLDLHICTPKSKHKGC